MSNYKPAGLKTAEKKKMETTEDMGINRTEAQVQESADCLHQ